MNYVHDLLTELSGRLPELEWKLARLNPGLFSKNTPKGLFRCRHDLTGANCINEIKIDIQSLERQDLEEGASYLAGQIKQKINVLVGLCQLEARTAKPVESKSFGIKMLSTRQQWLGSLELDIAKLNKQHQALTKAVEQIKTVNDASLLNLKAELGEVERQLTLAREAWLKATS